MRGKENFHMKKTGMILGAALLSLGIAFGASRGLAEADSTGHDQHPMSHANCPMKVTGSHVRVTEISGGVRIEVTASDTAAIREIRARAGRMGSGGGCEMMSGCESGAGHGSSDHGSSGGGESMHHHGH